MSNSTFPRSYVANLVHFLADSLTKCDAPLDAFRCAEVYEGFEEFDFKVTVQLIPKKPQQDRGQNMFGLPSQGKITK